MRKKKITDENILELAINAGAKDCISNKNIHEIISEKDDFYKVKSEIEKKIDSFDYSGIEWRPNSYLNLNIEESNKISQILEYLDQDDDVQDIFINCNIEMS